MAVMVTNPMAGLLEGYQSAGTPSNGTSQVDTITFDATGGTFKLAFQGHVTAAITWSATNNTLRDRVDTALEALSNVGTGGVTTAVGTMTAGVGTLTCTWAGNQAALALPGALTVANNSLTGTATLTVDSPSTTPGVTATARGAKKGAICIDTTNGKAYENTGTNLAPTWTVIGSVT